MPELKLIKDLLLIVLPASPHFAKPPVGGIAFVPLGIFEHYCVRVRLNNKKTIQYISKFLVIQQVAPTVTIR